MKRMNKFSKRILPVLLVMVLLLAAIPSVTAVGAEEAGGLNGDFESGIVGKPVTGWSLATTNSGGTYDDSRDFVGNYRVITTDESRSGSKAMALIGVNGTRGYVVAHTDPLAVTPGTDYSFSYALKIKNIEAFAAFYGGKVFVNQFDKDDNLLERQRVSQDFRADMDWESFTASVTAKADAAYVRLAVYIGGEWGKNVGVELLVDDVTFEPIPDDKLVNGDFETGSGVNDVYSWHLTSKTVQNVATTYNWVQNYSMVRDPEGYHGDGVAVTRNGMGYVSLDSNYIRSSPKTTYIVDYAFAVENAVYETFYGVRAYLAEFDKDKNLIACTQLHTAVREDTDWTEMSYSALTGENTAYIQVQIWMGGYQDANFTVHVDDVRLTKIIRDLSDDGIHNGNFEERLDGTVFDWTLTNRADAYFEATFDGYNGTKGVKCIKPGEQEHAYAVMQSNKFDVTAGKDYKLTYMSRLENQEGNVYIVAQIITYDKDGNVIERLRNSEFDHRTKSDEWEQSVGYFTMPEGVVSAKVEMLICGTAFDCWLDDFVWSSRDDSADVYGFDAIDKSGNLAGWTVSQPAAAAVDKKVYRNGSSSLFISQTLNVSTCTVTSDVLIPVDPETRYTFSLFVKSYDCNIDSDGMRLVAIAYDKNGKYLRKIQSIHMTMNANSDPSNWRELICGVSTGVDVAYVRMQLTVGSGQMNFWVDDLKWKLFDGNEYIEDFESVRDDGTPDGWEALVESGEPTFAADGGRVSISAETKQDVGTLSGMWNTAQEYSAFQFDIGYSATAGTEAKLSIKYYDIYDREIEADRVEKTLPTTNGEWDAFSFKFVYTSAKYAKIEIENIGAGTVSVEGITVTAVEEEKSDDELLTTWRGQWIWHYEDHYKCTYSTRYFRYHVALPGTPEVGTLQITADDKVKLWINGVEITVDGADAWEEVGLVEGLEEYMTAGDNVIAIEVYNGTSAAALLFDGYVETADGDWVDFYSTDAVVSAVSAPDNWYEKDFNDSSWGACRLLGPVGTAPWSDVEFDASAFVSDEIEVVEYEVTNELVAGEEAVLTMTVIPVEDFDKDIDFTGSLWIRNTLQNVYNVTLTQVDGPATGQWKAGESVTVSYRFKLPDFLAEARYVLQLNVNQIKISNPEIMNNKFTKAIRVSNENADGATVTAKLAEVNGGHGIEINGEVQPAMWYVMPSYQSFWSQTADQYMHDAGVCVTRLNPKIGGEGEWGIWTGEGEYDFSIVDTAIYNILAAHEDTYIVISSQLDVPDWWEEKYPEELVVTSSGADAGGVSFASDKMIEEATKVNLEMLEHIMQQPYANRIIGTVLESCRTCEWLWYGTGQYATDMSEVSQIKFREWLAEKYETDTALRNAWNDSSVTLETAKVPTFEERMGSTYTTFVDPATQRDTVDYLIFMQDLVADLLVDFSATITEAVDDRLIVGAYYGYMNNTYYYTASTTLHMGVEKVLEDPNIDFFAAPVLYNERYDGEAASYMMMIESVLAHGKTVMVENDTRTCTYHDYNSNFYTRDAVGPTYTVSDTLSQMQRDFANHLTRNVNQWYLNMWGSWFEHKQFSDQIEVFYNEKYVNLARNSEYDAEICYIIDEDMYAYLSSSSFSAGYDVLFWLLYEQRYELAKIGVPVDMYYLSDLEKGLIPDYKIYIMLSPVEIDAAEKAGIEKYLKNGDKTVVWEYICGASDGEKMTAQNMSDLIGIDVTLDATVRAPSASFTTADHWLIEGVEGEFFGTNNGQKEVSPLGIITDPSATVLAYMNDAPSQAALAIKDMGDWTSVYSAVPCLPYEVIVNLLEKQGVHRYSEDPGVVVFANDNYVAVNTAYGGEKTIKLDGTYAVYDVYGGTTYSLSTDTITTVMEDNDTKLFRLMPENTLSVYVNAGGNGSSEQAGYIEYAPGDTADCTITADDGYLLSAIVVDGVRTEISHKEYTVTFKKLDNNHFVKAEFIRVSEETEDVIADIGFPMWIVWVAAGVLIAAAAAVIVWVLARKNGKKQETSPETAGQVPAENTEGKDTK